MITSIHFWAECWGTTQPDPRAEAGGVLEEGKRAPSPPAMGLRESCKLPYSGVWGEVPAQNRYTLSTPVVSFKNLVTNNKSVFVYQNFP